MESALYDPKETDSHLPFAYAVTTVLPIDSVWRIFSDVALWSRISDVYESVEWEANLGYPAVICVPSTTPRTTGIPIPHYGVYAGQGSSVCGLQRDNGSHD